MSRDQTMYPIWPKSNNSRWNYWRFSIFSPKLDHAVILTFDLLTLNVCCRSGDTRPDYQILSEIEQPAAELLNI